MIRKPAERAGLELEDRLADEILKDAGTDPGALPLMAFCLEELYRQTALEHRLTVNAYNAAGRLRGAISRRAAALLVEFRETKDVDLDAALPRVFRALVHVDAGGTATRRWVFRDDLDEAPPVPQLITALIQGRLLLAENEEASGRAVITLAHEALLLEWPALREWLDCNHVQLQRVQMLITALGDANAEVRGSAAQALGQIGSAATEAVPALITALGDADAGVRGRAAQALGQIGPAATEAVLVTTLSSADARVRGSAAQVLGQIGPTAVSALITALRDRDTEVRRRAAQALGQIGSTATEAVPALVTALRNHDTEIRESVADVLGQIGPAAVPALITALRDRGTEVREAAAYALGQIGPAAINAVPGLIAAFSDAKKELRMSIADALGSIGSAAALAVPVLVAALSDADAHVRKAADTALERIGSAEYPVYGKQNLSGQQSTRSNESPFTSYQLEKTLSRALNFAKERCHEYATLEHLCLALAKDRDAIAVLRACGVDLDKLRSDLIEYLNNELSNLITNHPVDAKPTAGFRRVQQRAAIHVQSSGREEVTGANMLVALFSERESHAVYFLQEQEMTRYDAVNYISHGIAKNPKNLSTK